VHPKEDFDRWVAAQQRPADAVADAREGRDRFASLACINCHTVRGTAADGVFGPDLTHLMSRVTLGAGVARNTPENLRAWVRDPAALKPGALMPAMKVPDAQVDQIVSYLVTLR
jgi:cytochrome c oxidase subunit 2